MEMPNGFYKMICDDIERLEKSNKLSDVHKMKLLREIDGRYQACIKDWFSGLWYANRSLTRICYEKLCGQDTSYVQENLDMMKAKLEAFRLGMNKIQISDTPSTNVTVNTNVNISLTFEQARSTVTEMSSLTDEQTREVLERIDEIERVVNTDSSKKSKWEQIKPVLKWLADKSYDLGKTILPLLLKIEQ